MFSLLTVYMYFLQNIIVNWMLNCTIQILNVNIQTNITNSIMTKTLFVTSLRYKNTKPLLCHIHLKGPSSVLDDTGCKLKQPSICWKCVIYLINDDDNEANKL